MVSESGTEDLAILNTLSWSFCADKEYVGSDVIF